MKKILTSEQLHKVDAYTIQNEPVSSLELMERASRLVAARMAEIFDKYSPVLVFAGPGNNGGDALAVARLLSQKDFKVTVYLFNIGNKLSQDCSANRNRLNGLQNISYHEITTDFVPPTISNNTIVVDGLFGTGLSRPLMGGFASVVKYINASTPKAVVAIDVPSGLMTEDNRENNMANIVRADYTFTFHSTKLAFMFAENEQYLGKVGVLDIGLIDPKNEISATPYFILEPADIHDMIRKRPRHSHKGTFGHALLISGKKGMAGAAILASRACMRSGAGKLTVHTPEANLLPLQISIPEAIVDAETGSDKFATPFETSQYDAVAIGPGIGTDEQTAKALASQIHYSGGLLVLDADAINIVAQYANRIGQLPQETILTPHKKELRGLIGQTNGSYEELERTRKYAMTNRLYVIIKGADSAIVTPEGNVYFNPTGNPGMSTAGSGDVLTGILLALLAQDYPHLHTVLLGTYVHGLAGDIAAERLSLEGMIASDIIESLPEAFKQINK